MGTTQEEWKGGGVMRKSTHTKKNIYKEAISLLVAFFIQSIGYNDKPASGKQIRKPCTILGSACEPQPKGSL